MLALTQGLMSLGAGGGGGPGAHRYWRLFVTQNDGSTIYTGLTELEFFDALGVNRSAVSGRSAVSASSELNSGNERQFAFDGNLVNSGWLSDASGTLPQWIRLDVQNAAAPSPRTAYEVKTLRIYGSWNVPDASPRDFQLQWSDDDIAWTTALSVTGQTGWTANEMREFTVF